jgi:soluble lytic murein transglycosylase-like protein
VDGTTALVILLFVVTIFSSFGGNQGYSPSTSPPPTTPAVSQPAIPRGPIDPSYIAVVGGNARSSINKFISKYRKPVESSTITDSIMRHSQAYNVNPKLIAALMARESRFNPRAVSSAGAMGLGQLMPATCKTTGVTLPFSIDQNTKGTVRYMKYLLDRFKKYGDQVSFALAGYLEGPNAVARKKGYRASTGKYVRDILNYYNKI